MTRKIWTAGEKLNAVDLNNAFQFGGDSSDGILNISSGITNIDLLGASVFVLNYSDVLITGTGILMFSNYNSNGTTIVIRVSGDVILTSSAAQCIEVSNFGGAAGFHETSNSSGWLNIDSGIGGNALNIKTSGGIGGGNGVIGDGGAIDVSFFWNSELYKYLINNFGFIGGGGGAGSVFSSAVGGNPAGSQGGRGGGSLLIEVGNDFDFSGTIRAEGEQGLNGYEGSIFRHAGGGGGGGGGFVSIICNNIISNTGIINVSGGLGGKNDSMSTETSYGGGGGGTPYNSGDNGTSSNVASAKTGGDGGDGFSLVTVNNQF